MLDKIKNWGMFLLSILGVIALIQLFRKSDIDDSIIDISEELNEKQKLLQQIEELNKIEPTKGEVLEWLNNKL